MTRILLAVNDSPAGLAAARMAIRLGRESRGQVLAVTVVADDAREHLLGGRASDDSDARSRASTALLEFVSELARQAGVALETRLARGRPSRVILDQAAQWDADLIVLGRSGVRHVGQPFVGSQVLHVLEFAEVPVLVVPAM